MTVIKYIFTLKRSDVQPPDPIIGEPVKVSVWKGNDEIYNQTNDTDGDGKVYLNYIIDEEGSYKIKASYTDGIYYEDVDVEEEDKDNDIKEENIPQK